MSRVKSKYPRLFMPAAIAGVLLLLAAVVSLLVVPTVVMGVGDPWANSWCDQYKAKNPDNALGANNGVYAKVDYLGWLTLDMGAGEEIGNGAGNDFTVYGLTGLDYAVYVSNGSCTGPWTYAGTGSGTTSFELPIPLARWVKIASEKGKSIYIDAVKALYIGQALQPRITLPTEGTNITGTTQLLRAEDSSGGTGTVTCTFYYWYDRNCNGLADSGEDSWHSISCMPAEGVGSSSPTPSRCECMWDTSQLPDCCYILKVVMNRSGVSADSYTQGYPRHVTLSKNTPQPEIFSPDWGNATCDTKVMGNVTLLLRDNSFDMGNDTDITRVNGGNVTFEYCYGGSDCSCDSGWMTIPGTVTQIEGGTRYPQTGRYWQLEWDTTLMTDCCHKVRGNITDAHGRQAYSDEYCIGISNNDPQPAFIQPANNGTVFGSSVLLQVHDIGMDQGADVDCVKFEYCYCGNVTCGMCDCTDWQLIGTTCTPSGNTWSVYWDTTKLQDCFHKIRATMEDRHGRTGNTTICVGVSNTPPEANIVQPCDSMELNGCVECDNVSGNVTLVVVDELSGTDLDCATFDYWYDLNQNCIADQGEDTWHRIGIDNDPDGNQFSIEWDTTQVNDCCYIIRATVSDLHGRSDIDYQCIPVSNHDPEPLFIDPWDEPGCDPDLSGNVTLTVIDDGWDMGIDIDTTLADHGNVTFWYCYAGDDCSCDNGWTQILGNVTQGDCDGDKCWSIEWDTTTTDDCCHVIKVEMYDKHGRGNSTEICVGVGNNPPQPVILEPGNVTPCWDNEFNGTITLVAKDQRTGIFGAVANCTFEIWDDVNQNCDDDETWDCYYDAVGVNNSGCYYEWVPIGNATYNPVDGNWTLEWDSTDWPDECYLLRGNMTDIHGLSGYSNWINIYINNGPPAPYIAWPWDSYYWYDNGSSTDIRVVDLTDATDYHMDAGNQSCYLEYWNPCARTWNAIGYAAPDVYYIPEIGLAVVWWGYSPWYLPYDMVSGLRVTMTDKTGDTGSDVILVYTGDYWECAPYWWWWYYDQAGTGRTPVGGRAP